MVMPVTAYCNYSDDCVLGGPLNISVKLLDKCPHCLCSWQPTILNATYFKYLNEYKLVLQTFCTNCKEPILMKYKFTPNLICVAEDFIEAFPNNIQKTNFDDVINSLSPSFVKIYNEAEIAESYSLFEIAGVGYRKAFEFLIKDYAIKLFPEKASEIKSKALSKCIEDYINHKKIVDISKRTIWIGNDQTHYEQKFVGMGISDLKNLMDLSVHHITVELLTDEMVSQITKK